MEKPDGWMDELHGEPEPAGENAGPAPGIRGLRPLISWVQAGAWTDTAGSITAADAEEFLPCPVRCSPDSFVLRVRGESMEPRFRDGDLIFVDPAVAPDHGRFVVVTGEDSSEATFKQLIVEGDRNYPAHRPGQMHRVGRRSQRTRPLGFGHHLLKPPQRARQPRGQTLRQQAERHVALGAIPARHPAPPGVLRA